MADFVKNEEIKRITFKSISQLLILLMKKVGFCWPKASYLVWAMLCRTLQWTVDEYDAEYTNIYKVFVCLAGDAACFMCDNH